MFNRRIPRTLSTLPPDNAIVCLHCHAVSVLWRCIMVTFGILRFSSFALLLWTHNLEPEKGTIGLQEV